MTLPRLSAAQLEAIARTLTIVDFSTGAGIPWRPSHEQIEAWRFSEAHRRKFIAKPRRVFVSTAFDLEDAIWTATCDMGGHRVRCGVILDAEDKVRERTWQMGSFLSQLGIAHDRTSDKIVFPGGSEIVGLTAGGKRAGASTGFQRLRYSEFSYYTGDTASIMSTAGAEAEEVIETTVDITAPNGAGARHYWRSPHVSFARLFFAFESHALYCRGDPEKITDDEWEWAQGEGFTLRSAASYWLREIVPNRCGGDMAKAMHEYPQRPEHMFQASSLRTISATPTVRAPQHEIRVQGASQVWALDVYRLPEHTSGKCAVAVDTSLARMASRSVVLVLDLVDRSVCALLASDTIREDDLARVATMAQAAYEGRDSRGRPTRCPLIVESNGIGEATCHQLDRLGASYEPLEQSDESAERCLVLAKRAIEAGEASGPEELAEECDELYRDPKTGRYKGRKDVVMALGMILSHRQEDSPAEEPSAPPPGDRFVMDEIIREGKIIQRQARRSPWG